MLFFLNIIRNHFIPLLSVCFLLLFFDNGIDSLDLIEKKENNSECYNLCFEKVESEIHEKYIPGNYNLTFYENYLGQSTMVLWRFIPAEYFPEIEYSESADYAVDMANDNNATCAINASRFNMKTNSFVGYFRKNGKTIHENDKTNDSSAYSILCCKNGVLSCEPVTKSTEELDNKDYDWALYGWEAIIIDGQRSIRANQPEMGAIVTDFHPRSFIAQNYDGSYLIGVTDGRSSDSRGFLLSDVDNFLLSTGYNIRFAYSLDGGGSVSLVEKGKRVNPLIDKKKRKVKSIIYFKYD